MSTIYVTRPADFRPPGYTGRHRPQRSRPVYVSLGVLLAAAVVR